MESTQTETLIMSNGSVYTGEVKAGLPNGQGTMKYANGDVYEGEWKDGIPYGQCKYDLVPLLIHSFHIAVFDFRKLIPS